MKKKKRNDKINNDFSYYVQKFFTNYLADEMNCSVNTINTYRYTFLLLLEFLKSIGVSADKMRLSMFNRQLVLDFLDWLQKERKSSVSTRNNRLACIFSFCRFLQYEYPVFMNNYQEILAIHMKKDKKSTVEYMEIDAVREVISEPDKAAAKGYRDYMILMLLFETAARVTELINMKYGDFHMKPPFYVKILGKGSKERVVPLNRKVIDEVKKYMKRQPSEPLLDDLLFTNASKKPLTRAGITYIVHKYTDSARLRLSSNPDNKIIVPENVHCHTFRHSKAMALLQDDVNLVYIRDFLGHTSIQTTEVYARANSKKKQEAIENASHDIIDIGTDEKEEWKDKDILEWLKQLG